MSETLSLPTVITRRSSVLLPENWLMLASTFCRFTSKINGLSEKSARYARGGIVASNFVGFTTRKSCDPECVAKPEPLIDFRINPQFAAGPEPGADVERRIGSLAALIWKKTLRTHIGRAELWNILLNVGHLAMQGETVLFNGGRSIGDKVAPLREIADLIVEADAHALQTQGLN